MIVVDASAVLELPRVGRYLVTCDSAFRAMPGSDVEISLID